MNTTTHHLQQMFMVLHFCVIKLYQQEAFVDFLGSGMKYRVMKTIMFVGMYLNTYMCVCVYKCTYIYIFIHIANST